MQSPPSTLESQGPRGDHQCTEGRWGSELLSLWEPVSSAVKQKPKRHVAGWREARRHTDGCPQWALRGHPVPQVAHIITQPVLTTIRIPILEVRKVGCRKMRKLAHKPPVNCSAGIQAQATSLQRSSVRSPAHAGSTGQLQTHTCKSRKERNPQGNKSSSNDNTVRASGIHKLRQWVPSKATPCRTPEIQSQPSCPSGSREPVPLRLGGHHPAWRRSRRMTWGLCPAPARAFTSHTTNSSASCLGNSQPRHVLASAETRAKYSFHACDKNTECQAQSKALLYNSDLLAE